MAQKKHEYPDEYYKERMLICKKMVCEVFPEVPIHSVPWSAMWCEVFKKVTVNKRFPMTLDEIVEKEKTEEVSESRRMQLRKQLGITK